MKKIIKRTLQGIVGGLIISGTYFGRQGDYPPIYSHKTGESYGINISLMTDIDSGASVNGLNLSLGIRNCGKINGADVSLVNSPMRGTINGLELGILNGVAHVERTGKNNGVQIGLFNSSSKLNGAQIGIWNKTKENAGVILNVDYQGKGN